MKDYEKIRFEVLQEENERLKKEVKLLKKENEYLFDKYKQVSNIKKQLAVLGEMIEDFNKKII